MPQNDRDERELWSSEPEPHMKRRLEIIKAHPEVKSLTGYCPYSKYIVAFLVSVHFATAYFVSTHEMVWWQWVLITYAVGATCTHALFLAIHEISHDLHAKSKFSNQMLGMFANLPIVLPYSVAFRDYHLEHHSYQGTDGVDTDMPVRAEARLFTGKVGKAIWVMMQIGFYAFRPMCVK
jgi:sphingolipid 4-desaturase/C4-monooxygenase